MRYWVLGRDNHPKGPYEGSYIVNGVLQGKVDPSRQVCREGEQTWCAISDVPELNGLEAASALPEMMEMPEMSAFPSGGATAAAVSHTALGTADPRVVANMTRALAKEQRISMINRRVAAYLFEQLLVAIAMIFVASFIGTALAGQTSRMDPQSADSFASGIGFGVSMAGVLIWLVLRDIVPGLAWGRLWFKLRVVRDDTGAPPSVVARIGRNLDMVIPMMPLVEYFVAYYSPPRMRRLGDLFAGTRIEDLDPHGRGVKSHSGWMLLAVILTYLTNCVVIAVAVAAAKAQTAR